MREVVIVSGARTPVGAFGGALKSTPVVALGALVLKTALKRAGLRPLASDRMMKFRPKAMAGNGLIELENRFYDYDNDLIPVQIDEVVMGNVVGAGQGQNVARQSTLRAGISKETSAFTINKVCGSGMKAVALAAQAIACGQADIILAGGMENMSRIPFAFSAARWGVRMGSAEVVDLMVFDGLHEIFYDYHMGITAENIAQKYNISRLEQDTMSVESHQRARTAISQGLFEDEIVPVRIPQRNGESLVFDTDERPMDTSMEKISRLKPVFKRDGTVTAGNSSGINDAAAAILLMSKEKSDQLGLSPIAMVKAWASGGLDPAYMGLGAVSAVKKILDQEKLQISDFGAIELNEAFAVQALACMRELDCDPENTNALGGGISIGHPIGCTGARIIFSLANQLGRKEQSLGLASLCIGGGQGMAIVLENV